MKHFTLTVCSAAILLLSCNNNSDKTTDTKADTTKMADTSTAAKDVAPPPPPMPDSATIQKNWQSYMEVGDMQKMLASWNGTWDSDMSMWDKPGAEPTKTKGKVVNKMILGGRYQESVHTAVMMDMPFEGHSMTAYDNAKKMFQSTWVDNMGSGMMIMTGTWDAGSKSMTLTGKGVDPATLGDKDFREVFKIIDDNTQMMEMYCTGPDGKEMKNMEIKFTRKK